MEVQRQQQQVCLKQQRQQHEQLQLEDEHSNLASQEEEVRSQLQKLLQKQDGLQRMRQDVERRQQESEQQRLQLEAEHERLLQQQRQLEAERKRKQEHEQTLIEEFCRARFADEATARQHLEASGWNLADAMASYMPPIPDSPVAGRTLQVSNFKASYDRASAPEGPMDLGMLLGELIKGYCLQEGIDWRLEGQPFLKELQREAMRNMDDPIAEMMQRMWTSALTLRGKEFCFIFNSAVRGDDLSLADATAGLSRGMNKLCVTAGGAAIAVHPPGNVCFRGGGFDDRYRSFFVKGRQFR